VDPKKATITLLDANGEASSQNDPAKVVEVNFNPQSLRLGFRTAGAAGASNARDGKTTQSQTAQATDFVESMTVELLFDTTRDGSNVRATTLKLVNMIKAVADGQPPLIQFLWGDFLFRGRIQSMDETLDYFSEDGVPLRATVNLSINGNRKDMHQPKKVANTGAGFQAGFSAGVSVSAGVSAGVSASMNASAGLSVGTTPLTLTQAGDTLQSLAGRASVDWKAVASANNIDNPRSISPGTVVNLNASASARVK
jgi:hypothetical protein